MKLAKTTVGSEQCDQPGLLQGDGNAYRCRDANSPSVTASRTTQVEQARAPEFRVAIVNELFARRTSRRERARPAHRLRRRSGHENTNRDRGHRPGRRSTGTCGAKIRPQVFSRTSKAGMPGVFIVYLRSTTAGERACSAQARQTVRGLDQNLPINDMRHGRDAGRRQSLSNERMMATMSSDIRFAGDGAGDRGVVRRHVVHRLSSDARDRRAHGARRRIGQHRADGHQGDTRHLIDRRRPPAYRWRGG